MSIESVIGSRPRLEMTGLIQAAAQAGFQIKPRLITEWASIGLLDRPDPRGRGRGKGKSYTWSSEQAGLLLTILDKRREEVGRLGLLNVPCAIWLIWGEHYTPLRQARRALSTWASAALRVGPEKAGRSIRQTLKQLDHPDATAADRKALSDILQRIAFGNPYDRDDLVKFIRRVMDPNEVGLARGLPEGAAITPELYAKTIESRIRGAGHAQRDDLDDATWHKARDIYLAHGPVAPFLTELHRPNPTGVLTPQAHARFEYALNGACQHLVQLLGEITLEQQPQQTRTGPTD